MAGKKRRKSKQKQRAKQYRRGMAAIAAVLVVLLLVIFVQSNQLKKKNEVYAQSISELEKQIADEEERMNDIEEQKIYMQTKQYIEGVAKDKLGLVYEDEIIFKSEDK